MIEIKYHHNEPYLVINHNTIERDKIELLYNPSEITFEVISNEILSKIKRTPLNEIHLEHESDDLISIQFSYPWDISGIKQRVYLVKEPKDTYFRLLIDFSWELEKWKNIFSTEELLSEINKITTNKYDISANYEMEGYEFSFICDINQNNNIEDYLHIANQITRSAVNQLMIENKNGSLTSVFDFPEHVRTPSEQYLIYFAQFLKELGIDAYTDIKHEAGIVLFSVTPVSNQTALEQIRHALDIYLQMPVLLSGGNYLQIPNDPKIQQLMANIQHLNGQLLLSNAIAQAKEETIHHQQILIKQQQQIIDASILQSSLLYSSHDENNEKEELLGGTVSITKYEGNGFEVNLPTIFRWIKDRIRKD